MATRDKKTPLSASCVRNDIGEALWSDISLLLAGDQLHPQKVDFSASPCSPPVHPSFPAVKNLQCQTYTQLIPVTFGLPSSGILLRSLVVDFACEPPRVVPTIGLPSPISHGSLSPISLCWRDEGMCSSLLELVVCFPVCTLDSL